MEEFRKKIDRIDAQMLELFLARMRVSEEIASYKKIHNVPVEDKEREAALIKRLCRGLDPEAAYYVKDFFEEIIALSKDVQRSIAEDGETPPRF